MSLMGQHRLDDLGEGVLPVAEAESIRGGAPSVLRAPLAQLGWTQGLAVSPKTSGWLSETHLNSRSHPTSSSRPLSALLWDKNLRAPYWLAWRLKPSGRKLSKFVSALAAATSSVGKQSTHRPKCAASEGDSDTVSMYSAGEPEDRSRPARASQDPPHARHYVAGGRSRKGIAALETARRVRRACFVATVPTAAVDLGGLSITCLRRRSVP